MNILEILTNTRQATWSYSKFHLDRIEKVVKYFESQCIKKAYILGYAEEEKTPALIQCINEQSVRCLNKVFNSIPFLEDDLGLKIEVPICVVYAIVCNLNKEHICIIASSGDSNDKSSKKLLYFELANGFPFRSMFSKVLLK